MERASTVRPRFRRAKPGTANENGIQQGVPPLRATSGAKVNADVGPGNILAVARTMDPPQLRNEGHARRGNDFRPKPGTADE